MQYISTRGNAAPMNFFDAVMTGLAEDGGLLIPATTPQVNSETLKAWASLSFRELAVEVILPYVQPDLSKDALTALVDRSYQTFSHPEVTPLVEAGDRRILELFHGPTAAFKDVALQFLGNLFEHILQQRGGRLNILGATSGDTGSAAIYGVRGKAGIEIFILHPKGRVSPIQERQMTTVLDANVHNIAIRGSFDDGQHIVKALFNDLPFKKEYTLGAVNSINWARIVAQIVYYFYAWSKVTGGDTAQKASFSVPTGNFGDIFAGFMAKRMGLPIDKLIIATNRNDILTRFVHTGVYEVGEVYPTITPSMDIQVASNFERYLYFLMDESPEAVRGLMGELKENRRFALAEDKKAKIASDFIAKAVNEEETLDQIRATHAASGYILDPHTAVGVRAAQAHPEAICLATAHPAKFGSAVTKAIGQEADAPSSLQGLMDKEHRCAETDASETAVKQYIIDTLPRTDHG